MRAVGGGGCVGGCGEVIAGRYEGEWSNCLIHGKGVFTAAKAGWTFTGAFAHWRPTEGELSEADGRRFAVHYAADCAEIFNNPTPSSKVRVGSVSPRARTSMVLERRRRASAALLVPACAGVCVCPATEHRPHLTTWPCRRPCSRRGAEAALRASDALRWAAERARAVERRARAGEGRRARAGVLAIVDYLALPYAAAVGYLFFGEVPALAVWLGAGLIVVACLIVTRR